MLSFKVRPSAGAEYVRVARPLWAKLFFSHRRLYKCTVTGRLMLVHPRDIEDVELQERQARASQFTLNKAMN